MDKLAKFLGEDYISHEELAEMMGVKPRSLSSMITRGIYKFRRVKFGRKVFYLRSEVRGGVK